MHGVWLLVLVPIAAVVGWRYSSQSVRKVAMWLSLLAAVALVGWFGYLTFSGTELTASIYDRVLHSLGVIISSINVPIIELIAALGLIVEWPKKWEFSNEQRGKNVLDA